MAKATRVHSTPRRTASKIQTKKGAKVKRPAPDADAKLTAAYTEIAALDKALDALYKKYGNCPGSGFSLRQTKGPGQFGGVLGQGFDDGPTLLLGG